jgi:hypothetical protein
MLPTWWVIGLMHASWAVSSSLTGVTLKPHQALTRTPYFHSDRHKVTYHIYELLPEQRNALLEFLLTEEPPSVSPLSILADQNNRVRVDPEEPVRTTGIYRDLWERKEISPDVGDARERDV